MAEASGAAREVNARIVYWGVEGAGKESNLRSIHGKLRPDHRGRLEAVPTALDPSVCSWRLPIELGEIAGVRTRIQVVAVPGGAEQAPTRKQLLDRVDGVVFVVDARRDRIDANVAAFEELRSALAAYGRALESVPLVVQYNHHDQSDPFVLEELHRKLDVKGAAVFEARASDGTGVLPTLTTISKRVVRELREAEAAKTPRSLATSLLGATRNGVAAAPAAAAAPAPDPPIAARALPSPARLDPRATAILVEVAPDPAPAALDLEAAALAPEVDLLDDRDDALDRAQDLLDPSWSDVAGELDATPGPAAPLGPASLPGGWHVVSAEAPEIVGASTLQIPLVIADHTGRELGFRLTISLEPLLDD
jgi:signal recognition particle receptor subunit beta